MMSVRTRGAASVATQHRGKSIGGPAPFDSPGTRRVHEAHTVSAAVRVLQDFSSLQGTLPPLAQPATTTEQQSGKCGLRFDDPRAAFAAHSNAQLLRGVAVFSACSVKPLVSRADSGLRLVKRVLGRGAVNAAIRHTFFKHFCAGPVRHPVPRQKPVARSAVSCH